ncbi:MAG: hypothetical protein P8R42_08550 [Candidatus Binatia bacterium]|nr:hypothetical protein [Candidatus Binatia bacterium]
MRRKESQGQYFLERATTRQPSAVRTAAVYCEGNFTGVAGLGGSRIENIEAMRRAGVEAPMSLIRSPMISQAERVVSHSDMSLHTELGVLRQLSAVAQFAGVTHRVVLMVELGDLRADRGDRSGDWYLRLGQCGPEALHQYDGRLGRGLSTGMRGARPDTMPRGRRRSTGTASSMRCRWGRRTSRLLWESRP